MNSTALATSSSLVTSRLRAVHRGLSSSSASDLTWELLGAVATTAAPSSCKCRAVAWPIPPDAPVIRMTLPSRDPIVASLVRMNIVDNSLPEDGKIVKAAQDLDRIPLRRAAPQPRFSLQRSIARSQRQRRWTPASWPRGRHLGLRPIREPGNGCARQARVGSARYRHSRLPRAERDVLPPVRSAAGMTGGRRRGTNAAATPRISTFRRAPGCLRRDTAGHVPPSVLRCFPAGLQLPCARSACSPYRRAPLALRWWRSTAVRTRRHTARVWPATRRFLLLLSG